MFYAIPFAAGPLISLDNTNFVVFLGFAVFVGILIYAKVPGRVATMLDARATKIRADLDEARSLREEAQTLLASFERKQKEVADQAASIVSAAKIEAEAAAALAREDMAAMLERRLQTATEQIASAEKAAIKSVKDRAASVAISAAAQIIAAHVDAARGEELIAAAIKDVSAKLH